ncbi:hypothetical protein FOCC_FOCC013576 [Frankliniella occidentalis]|nr:hypothetical protein FOCC_FOCC013576 [Frankliniella occidentalis]
MQPYNLVKMKGLVLFLCLALARVSLALPAASSYLSDNDRSRLRQVLDGAWDVTDLPTIHYGALGYKLLGQAVPKPQVGRVLFIVAKLYLMIL